MAFSLRQRFNQRPFRSSRKLKSWHIIFLVIIILFLHAIVLVLLLVDVIKVIWPVNNDVNSQQSVNSLNQTNSSCICPQRPLPRSSQHSPVFAQRSTCTDNGTFYSPNQNVVTFSLHIPFNHSHLIATYAEGIHLNLQAMRQYYPNFTMRLYTDYEPELPEEDPLCKAYCENPDLFWCDIRKTPLLGDQSNMYFMTWRFLALGDPTVDIFLSRDLDSVITSRESAAVWDWLQLPEKKGIHLMRDKFEHHTEMLGGLWGARNSWLENVWLLARDITGTYIPKSKGADQDLLSDVIYYPRKHDILAHDSYHCHWYTETMIRPFPTKRQGPDKNGTVSDFVGSPGFGRAKYKDFDKCPRKCRPRYGAKWEYC